ncbi:uncharacterized protein LOC113225796 isoform X6 [Hyposmocoma kahamanoa]|uniref:uncharacterized protein LOC113225796 isoform X6 n=1 Tax=Hyposmocoma kahamanoa TaxID=1477025 RepID=UPI000E6D9D80|nr:uncharacterized protein LOC113225796 isoform X6 [Hyposmocoma kahamanoa]
MAYNKYNTRNSGRYNTPGQFVSAGELVPGVGAAGSAAGPLCAPLPPASTTAVNQQQQQQQQQPLFNSNPPPPIRKTNMQQNLQTIQTQDIDMKEEYKSDNSESSTRPPWMKNKLQGVKKVSNKERRRRQNENLRRLLTPKNALMVLNEMLPNEQLANNNAVLQQFKVEPANPYYSKQHSFCADLTVAGNSYKGYGENKLTARNAAAEQAIRDLIIKKMNKVLSGDAATAAATAAAAAASAAGAGPGAGAAAGSPGADENSEEEALPMIQLASFALHKLFSEWEYEGHKVPQLKPSSGNSLSEPSADVAAPPPAPAAPKVKPPKTAKDLPLNAGAMHPCMLLTFMRPHLEYRELAIEGDRPQNMLFTLGVDVDGATYVGKASNKKEARKLAAKAACSALFGVVFDEHPSSNTPVLAKTE